MTGGGRRREQQPSSVTGGSHRVSFHTALAEFKAVLPAAATTREPKNGWPPRRSFNSASGRAPGFLTPRVLTLRSVGATSGSTCDREHSCHFKTDGRLPSMK